VAATDLNPRVKRNQKDLKLPSKLDVVVEPKRLSRMRNLKLRDLKRLKKATVAVANVEVEVAVVEDKTEMVTKLKAATREKKETEPSVLPRHKTPTLGFLNSITKLNARNMTSALKLLLKPRSLPFLPRKKSSRLNPRRKI
jgi:hypothetical protein